MLVLGIDPGTAICGYGLVEMRGNHLKAIHYGAVITLSLIHIFFVSLESILSILFLYTLIILSEIR